MLLNNFYKANLGGENTYAERISIKNQGEDLFKQYCFDNSIYCARFGFDERTNNNVPAFYNLNPFIRNLPDFYIHNPLKNASALIMVKGTRNLKQSEFDMLDDFNVYYASEQCPLYYAFCFPKYEKPVLLGIDKVKYLYLESEDQKWESDGKIYRKLDI